MSAIIRMVAKRSFEQICVGDKGVVSKTITEADVANFAGMTGDFNPLHVNQEYAKSSRFGQRVVHGSRQHIDAQHHARPAPGRRIVDGTMPVDREIAYLHRIERPLALGHGLDTSDGAVDLHRGQAAQVAQHDGEKTKPEDVRLVTVSSAEEYAAARRA